MLLLLALAACKGTAPPVDVDCTRDDECGSVSVNEKCCSMCGPVAATKKSAEARSEACKDQGGGPPRCPHLDCPKTERSVPKCVSNRCSLVSP